MANEAVKVEGPYEVHDFTVADGATISAMTLCTFSDPRTAVASSAVGTAAAPIVWAGIAGTEKTASSGATNLGLITTGIHKLTAGQNVPAGSLVTLSGTNLIMPVLDADAVLSGAVIGKALETIAPAGTGEVKIGVLT